MADSAQVLSLAETAARVSLSADRFRKVWRQWQRQKQFPAPFKCPDAGRGGYAWDAVDVEAWKAQMKRANAEELAHSNDNPTPKAPPPPEGQRLSRDRDLLRALMNRGARQS